MEIVRLRSGREICIRPIAANDAPGLRLAYARLSPESQYQRFLASKPYLSAGDARYLTQVDGADHSALVATPIDRPRYILGVGRYVRLAEDPAAAEFAVAVGDPYQNEGIATELLERLALAARSHGIKRFTATMLADNGPAHRLLRRLARTGLVPYGEMPGHATERRRGAIDEVVVELAA